MDFIGKTKETFKNYCEGSLIIRGFKAIARFFASLFNNSLVAAAFTSESLDERVAGSFFGRAIFAFFGLFKSAGDKVLKDALHDSAIIGAVRTILNWLFFLPLYIYGATGLIASMSYGAACYLLHGYVNYIVFSAFFAFGLLLVFVKAPLSTATFNSAIFRAIFKGKAALGAKEAPAYQKRITPLIFSVAFGAVLGMLTVYFSPLYVLGAFFAAAYALALICYPETGIYTAVALAPFLPTMVLAGLIAVTSVCFVLGLIFSDRYSFKMDGAGLFALTFALLLLICAVTSYTPAASIRIALLEILFIFSYFLIIAMADTKRKVFNLIFVYLTSSLFTGFVGIYQYLSGMTDQTWVDTELFEQLSFRAYSTFENPNVYGEYLLLTIVIAGAMILVSKKLVSKIYYLGVSAVLFVNLALTYSRGCYLAILVAGVIFIFFAAKKLAVLFSGLFAGAVFVSPWVLPRSVIDRFASISNLSDSSTAYRINIWRGTVLMLKDFWALGTGLGRDAFNVIYPRYALSTIFAPHAHCLYLQIAAEMGVMPLVIFLCMVFCFFNLNITAFIKSKDRQYKILIAAFISAASAFLFESLFEYTFYNYRVFLIFFMFLGLANAFSKVVREGKNG